MVAHRRRTPHEPRRPQETTVGRVGVALEGRVGGVPTRRPPLKGVVLARSGAALVPGRRAAARRRQVPQVHRHAVVVPPRVGVQTAAQTRRWVGRLALPRLPPRAEAIVTRVHAPVRRLGQPLETAPGVPVPQTVRRARDGPLAVAAQGERQVQQGGDALGALATARPAVEEADPQGDRRSPAAPHAHAVVNPVAAVAEAGAAPPVPPHLTVATRVVAAVPPVQEEAQGVALVRRQAEAAPRLGASPTNVPVARATGRGPSVPGAPRLAHVAGAHLVGAAAVGAAVAAGADGAGRRPGHRDGIRQPPRDRGLQLFVFG